MKSVITTIILIALTIALILGAVIPVMQNMKNTGGTASTIVKDLNNNLSP